jgi:DinB superfamily
MSDMYAGEIYTTRPDASEHIPYYAKYISLVPNGNILTILEKQLQETLELLPSISEEQSLKRYAPDKWSIKEVVGHLTDTERVFVYRALRFARGDETPLPGFESDDYVRVAQFDTYPWQELAREFESVRRATILFYKHLDEAAWGRRGVANGDPISVRALAYIIAGHELHHVKLLKELYL